MIKKVLGVCALALCAVFGVQAQQPQLTPMPLNPNVKHGILPNGMNYYILHNEEPKERANFYIAQKVGSTLETPEQLGLAHFLEHMAFNGTSHYPGKDMLNYLMSKGIRFGDDINAYTSFDETVYNINNVPTSDKALMDSVLLVLHDWSCELLLEDKEIESERGVIEEEWRSRNNANQRMYETILPQIYKEYNYQQMPIGKIDIIRSFDPEVLRAYYKKWYRPDQQGLIIVGDFDAAEMEQKVKEMFSTITMPENAAERVYPHVSDNEQPIYTFFEDPELQYPTALLSFKSEKTPFEMRNTIQAYLSDEVLETVVSMLINNRLQEYMAKPECAFAYAGVDFGDFYVSKTKSAFDIRVIGKNGISKAFEQAMGIVARACKTGFTTSELERVRTELVAIYEKAYNERDKTSNKALSLELIRHFVDNEPAPGAEMEYQLIQQMLPMIPVEAINEAATSILTPENEVLVVSMPQREGVEKVSEQQMLGILNNSLNAEYEAYVDEVITDPLIAKMPKAGKVVSESAGAYGSTVMKLSNGATVIVKPTDYKADEIKFEAYREGGRRQYKESQAPNVKVANGAFEAVKWGDFDAVKMQKYLAGKHVSLGYSVGNYVDAIVGQSTVKDLNTMMEMIYTAFTNLNPDPATFQTLVIDQLKTSLAMQDKNPQKIFSGNVTKSLYGNNPMFNQMVLADVDAINYDETLNMIKESLANAAEYTFIFVGNVDMATFKPMIEQYIASLPANSKKVRKSVPENTNVLPVAGIVENDFTQEMSVPATMVFDFISGDNLPYTVENGAMIDLAGEILSNIFTETLREEEGGTYSPYAGAYMNPSTGQWIMQYQFITNADMKDKLVKRAYDEWLKMLADGVTETQFNKVKEAAVKQLEINERTNSYWLNALLQKTRGYETVGDGVAAIQSITLDKFNSMLKNLYNGKNRIEVIMNGVEAK